MNITEYIKKNEYEISKNLLNTLISAFFYNKDKFNYELNEKEIKFLDEKIKEIKSGRPIQYVIGNVDFYGFIIDVNESVLIPRFETETLVEKTVKYINEMFDNKVLIADLGTGSGCIAIALKKLIDCNVDAVDISPSSLNVAKHNAKKNEVEINFLEGDMLKPLTKKYDCLISNPPYIDYDEEIMDIVKDYEPNIALYAPDSGMYFYKEIIKNAKNYIKKKSIIAFEIGYMQGKPLTEYAKIYFPNAKIIVENDLSGKNRYLFIINN